MVRLIGVIALLALTGCATTRHAAPVTSPVTVIEEQERRLQQANINGNRDVQRELLAESYALVTSAGVFDRTEVLSGLETFTSTVEDVQVVVDGAGDSARVTMIAIRVRPGLSAQSVDRAHVVRLWRLGADRVWRAEFEQWTDVK
jgi:hypothetical protein